MEGSDSNDAQARFLRIKRLFDAAVELPEAERLAFLERECPEEPDVRKKVERLLARNAEAGGLSDLAEEAGGVLRSATSPRLRPGTRIGPYRLERLLG
jgi:serine/threonine-protein kinase